MAELSTNTERLTGTRLASGQIAAIAWLRWRIVANGFRRKGGALELIGRLILLPVFAALAMLPTVGAGVFAWHFARTGQLGSIVWILWAAFGLTQLLNINLGQPGTTFDPVELIRFPLPLSRYILVRLFFGLLSPGNIIVSLMSVAVFAGVAIARPHLRLAALVAMLVFALTNVFFTRMVFAWVDRWLSTRRAREVFTAFIFLFSLGAQYVNVRFNPGLQHNHRRHQVPGQDIRPLQARAQRLHPYLRWLPPEFASAAIVSASRGRPGLFLADTAACAAFGMLFLGIYSTRMRTEFRGENLSETANATRPPVASVPAQPRAAHASAVLAPAAPAALPPRGTGLLPAALGPLLQKELLVLRRNIGLFYGLVAPVVMVFLFAGRMSGRSDTHWVLLGAVGYSLLGISPMSYNSFGTEGTGAQLYFFAPVPLRDVFFAKNVFTLLLALVEVAAVIAITTYVAGRPHLVDCAFALLWALGTLLLNTCLGNLRSISAPKKVNPGRTMKKAQSPVSAYIAMGVLLGCAGLGAVCELLALYLRRPWIGVALMLAYAATAVLVYARALRGIEAYALERRDILFEELGKKI